MNYKFKLTALLVLLSVYSTNSFALDIISGKAKLNGKEAQVNIETSINQAKFVVINSVIYSILRINESTIEATNSNTNVVAVFNDALIFGILVKTKKQLVEYYALENGKELNCTKKSPKAFIVVSKDGRAIGNCVY